MTRRILKFIKENDYEPMTDADLQKVVELLEELDPGLEDEALEYCWDVRRCGTFNSLVEWAHNQADYLILANRDPKRSHPDDVAWSTKLYEKYFDKNGNFVGVEQYLEDEKNGFASRRVIKLDNGRLQVFSDFGINHSAERAVLKST